MSRHKRKGRHRSAHRKYVARKASLAAEYATLLQEQTTLGYKVRSFTAKEHGWKMLIAVQKAVDSGQLEAVGPEHSILASASRMGYPPDALLETVQDLQSDDRLNIRYPDAKGQDLYIELLIKSHI